MARVWIEDRATQKDYVAAMEKWRAAKKAGSNRQPPGRWRVRWYDPDGKSKGRVFGKKPEAENHVHEVEARLRDGSYRDRAASKMLFGALATEWFDSRDAVKRSSLGRYRHSLDLYILPRWKDLPLSAIRREDIAAWSVELGKSGGKNGKPLGASSVKGSRIVFGMVMNWAVETHRIAFNPAAGLAMPRPVPSDHVYLDHAQVHALAAAAGPYGPLILVSSYTGMRWGEVSALRARRVDLEARRVHVVKAYAEDGGELYEDTPKSWARRKVPLSGFLVDELRPLLAKLKPDDLLFTAPEGGPLRLHNFRPRVFDQAVKAAGLADLGIHPHVLKHTAASLAIAAGADIKTLQTMLGHKSATLTLDTYGHLMSDRLDDVADRLSEARAKALGKVPKQPGTPTTSE
ncbi:site-specific integrase [Kitasatospora sp. NBC_00240]|uniref:tyrosine-type recombinase/integrase n=1 Tax=Kitasatospora sp. NBC_00240 TaxID=2903567 RepID=UPI002253E824|nr:site-specific integrase [Kitasatospora sp. NBC_00240]MCX5211481.1 site-specific integrase [Kitasatospora sp. NBC_00240]